MPAPGDPTCPRPSRVRQDALEDREGHPHPNLVRAKGYAARPDNGQRFMVVL